MFYHNAFADEPTTENTGITLSLGELSSEYPFELYLLKPKITLFRMV